MPGIATNDMSRCGTHMGRCEWLCCQWSCVGVEILIHCLGSHGTVDKYLESNIVQ